MRHWWFVLSAYGLAALVLTGYWRWVERRIQALDAMAARRSRP